MQFRPGFHQPWLLWELRSLSNTASGPRRRLRETGLFPAPDHRFIQDGGVAFLYDRRVGAHLLFLFVEDFGFDHGAIGTIAGALGVDAGAGHEFFDGIDRFGAVVDGLVVLAAHDDGFFRARVDAEPAVDAAHHVDIKALRELLDFRIRMLAGFNVNALGRTDRGAHVTGYALQASIIANGNRE